MVGTPDLNRDGRADVLLQSASAPPRAKTPFGFVGKAGYYSDEESGLQLLGHRYYLPKLGRFLTQDPTGHDAGLNLYEYANNNPIRFTDPSGLYATVTVDPRNPKNISITVPIEFKTTEGGRIDNALRNRIIKNIEKAWSGKFGKYNVKTTVEWVDPVIIIKPDQYNEITMIPGEDLRSNCYAGFFSSENGFGNWYLEDPQFDWMVAHEAGHLMRLGDRYKDTADHKHSNPDAGWKGNMMAERGGVIQEKNIAEIINRYK